LKLRGATEENDAAAITRQNLDFVSRPSPTPRRPPPRGSTMPGFRIRSISICCRFEMSSTPATS
jgi:hypothetical protein